MGGGKVDGIPWGRSQHEACGGGSMAPSRT